MDAQEKSPAPAFRGQHQPKPLGFDPSKLNGLSEKLIRSHWENNYGNAVRALNGIEQRLDAMMKEKMHNAPTGSPLLVLDMYEHAFHMDYGAAAAKYLEAFMHNVRWEEVNRRFVAAQRAASALRA